MEKLLNEVMSENIPFALYRSSAGSGKTYTLAKEYLKLALQHPFKFRSVLAVTFTNKATQEMKSRVISFLEGISVGRLQTLENEIIREVPEYRNDIRNRSKKVLECILHDYENFSVSTIDSFFQKIVHSFGKEIGIKGNIRVELDGRKIVDEATLNLIDSSHNYPELLNYLKQYVHNIINEGKNWDLQKDIKKLAYELLKENFKTVKPVLLKELTKKTSLTDFRNNILEKRKKIETKVGSIGRKAIEKMGSANVTEDDFFQKGRGVAGFIQRLETGKFIDPTSNTLKALEEDKNWLGKADKNNTMLLSVINRDLMPLLKEYMTLYEENKLFYNSSEYVLKDFYALGIFTDLLQRIEEYKKDNNIILLSDGTQFIRDIIADNDTPFIYERTGTRYSNYMIDEFQDTSELQWENFRPLIQNSLDEYNKSIIVGDVKQSIYRWRGGDWDLLQNRVVNDFSLTEKSIYSLTTNFRSSKEIVDFNNNFFQSAVKWVSEKVEEYGEAYKTVLEDSYADVKQNCHKSNFSGFVRATLLEMESNGKEGYSEQLEKKIPEIIENLQQKGFEARDITFLVRRVSEGQQIAEILMKHKNSALASPGFCYDVISDEALILSNTGVIRLLIHTMKWLMDPSDENALLISVSSWQELNGVAGEESGSSIRVAKKEEVQDPFDRLEERRNELLELPADDLIEYLINIFEIKKSEGQWMYVFAFQDVVRDFGTRNSLMISEFLDWWEETGKSKSLQLPEDIDAMRIMTIHKSKGLQFKVVIMPFCDWSMEPTSDKQPFLWCSTRGTEFEGLSFVPVKYQKKLLNTCFRRDYTDEFFRNLVDNLNLLYVAFTRAEYGLELIIPKKESERGITTAQLILSVLGREKEEILFGKVEKPDSGEKDSAGKIFPISHFNSQEWSDKIRIVNAQNQGKAELETRRKYGLLLHDILSDIKYDEELEYVLENYSKSDLLFIDYKKEIRETVESLLKDNTIKNWFSKKWNIRTECEILNQGSVLRPDRIVEYNDSEVDIIDYKTGVPKESHEIQVKNYVNVLKEMGYAKVRGFLLYTDRGEIMEC